MSSPEQSPEPPRAERRPTTLSAHGHDRIDDWYWLRERDNPSVRAYLADENEFTAKSMAHTIELQTTLFEELKSHVQEDDASPPVSWGPWQYSTRTIVDQQYALHERAPRGGGTTQLLLDENELAQGHDYFAVGDFAVDPSHRLIAYSVDTSGAELYLLRIRNLDTGLDLTDTLEGLYYSLAWSSDSKFLFYTKPDAAMRPFQVWRHELGATQHDDVCVFEEPDERFDVWVRSSRSDAYIFIGTDSRVTSEVHFVAAAACTAPLKCIASREEGVEYHVDHQGDRFVIWTNGNNCTNFEVYVAPTDPGPKSRWSLLVAHDPDVRVAHVSAFAAFLLFYERTNGLERLRVRDNRTGEFHTIALPDPVYTVWPGGTREFDVATIRYEYSSLIQPRATFDYEVASQTSSLVKQQPVPLYQQDQYITSRAWATAPDGVQVPISVVHHRSTPLDGTAPLHLYGYGSYESSVDPTFDRDVLPLLDRGWVYAIAHPRGGGEMGRGWYEDGKLLSKMNTFTDFIACAEHLISANHADANRIIARGASAGGLLMGAIANLRPDLWQGIVAEVPFVDVLTTMSDASIPLTVGEWDEWGNPDNESDYAAMLEYSPYDNLRDSQRYPRLLITGGLNDPRVQYWEPAKYVAKMRAISPDTDILLKMEMGAGHGGPSGRYDRWHDEAFTLAWILTTSEGSHVADQQ